MLQCCNVARLQCYNVSILKFCNGAMLQCYNAVILHCYNVTAQYGATGEKLLQTRKSLLLLMFIYMLSGCLPITGEHLVIKGNTVIWRVAQ